MIDILYTSWTVEKKFSTGAFVTRALTLSEHVDLLQYYSATHPDAQVLSHRAPDTHTSPRSEPNYLKSQAKFYDSIVLHGRRVVASRSASEAPNSIVQAFIANARHVGQVVDIFGHRQTGVNECAESVLFRVRWFKALEDRGHDLWHL